MNADPQMPQIPLRDRFVAGMSHAACTVNVVTTDGPTGRAGVTVSAMASVSADGEAPTLLICVHHLSPAAPKIIENGVLCVNVLREDQSYISEAFAGRFKDELGDKFECTDWVVLANGTPRVADPLVAFECRVLSAERVGTHHVLLCGVEDTHSARLGSPLIYANRSYGSSRRIEAPRSMRGVLNGEGIKLKVGCFHTFGPFLMPSLIRQLGGLDIENFFVSLILLGVGWNFGFIGATAMITDCHTPEERGKVQGANDFLVFGTVAAASFFSGSLLTASGWEAINWMIFPIVAIVLMPLLWQAARAERVRA